jgi:hypothetical protein
MRNINRQKIQAFNILSNKNIVYILLVSGILVFLINPVYAQANHQPKEIPLWSAGNMPGGTGPQGSEVVSPKGSYTNIAQPHLIVHYPEHPNGMAVLVISGGGYAHIEVGSESSPAAEWLASQGITAFELIYRLPAEGWSTVDVPFQDAQRAIRVIRDMAERMGISRNKVGVMGFSAGGHLAAMIETEPERQFYAPIDDIDRHSAKCDFAALVYPVITMLPPYNHTHSIRTGVIRKHIQPSFMFLYIHLQPSLRKLRTIRFRMWKIVRKCIPRFSEIKLFQRYNYTQLAGMDGV